MIREEDASTAHQEDRISGKESAVPASRLIRRIERYLRLLNITRDAILCVDDQCRICAFNQGAEKLSGYKRDEVLGQPLLHLHAVAPLVRDLDRVGRLVGLPGRAGAPSLFRPPRRRPPARAMSRWSCTT